MRLFITGASGLVGRHLCRALLARGDEVVALSRSSRPSPPGLRWVQGDETNLREWQEALTGCDAVVNLAGAPVARRWTRARRLAIVRSRVGITTALYHAMANTAAPPRTMISASAVGYYGTDLETSFTEESPPGRGFLADVCAEWENAAVRTEALGVRVVRLRLGMILAADGGALPALARPVRLFFGGALGSGEQWISWLQVDDLVALVAAALADPRYVGPLNAVSPNPMQQRAFVGAVAQHLGRPLWLDVPAWAMKLLIGEMAEQMLLAGQRVLPAKAAAAGFSFSCPDLVTALDATSLRR